MLGPRMPGPRMPGMSCPRGWPRRRLLLLRLLLGLVAAAALAAAGLALAGPWFEAEGIRLPWAAPPRAPYVVRANPPAVPLGGLWGVRVSPFFDRPLLGVEGTITGLRGVSQVVFYPLDGSFVALVPVSFAAVPGEYHLELRILDHRRREHPARVTLTVQDRPFLEQRLRAGASQVALWTPDRLAEDRARTNAARAHPTPQALWEGPLVLPVQGRVTTEFGVIRTVNGVISSRHSGIDWAAPLGTPVLAAARGRVVFAGSLWVAGHSVILDHGLGLFSAYNHLSRIIAHEGQMVQAGELIGEVGSSGFSTGNHLHFTLWHGSIATNPWPWFEADLRVLLGD